MIFLYTLTVTKGMNDNSTDNWGKHNNPWSYSSRKGPQLCQLVCFRWRVAYFWVWTGENKQFKDIILGSWTFSSIVFHFHYVCPDNDPVRLEPVTVFQPICQTKIKAFNTTLFFALLQVPELDFHHPYIWKKAYKTCFVLLVLFCFLCLHLFAYEYIKHQAA